MNCNVWTVSNLAALDAARVVLSPRAMSELQRLDGSTGSWTSLVLRFPYELRPDRANRLWVLTLLDAGVPVVGVDEDQSRPLRCRGRSMSAVRTRSSRSGAICRSRRPLAREWKRRLDTTYEPDYTFRRISCQGI